jgi:hypothetical protein
MINPGLSLLKLHSIAPCGNFITVHNIVCIKGEVTYDLALEQRNTVPLYSIYLRHSCSQHCFLITLAHPCLMHGDRHVPWG